MSLYDRTTDESDYDSDNFGTTDYDNSVNHELPPSVISDHPMDQSNVVNNNQNNVVIIDDKKEETYTAKIKKEIDIDYGFCHGTYSFTTEEKVDAVIFNEEISLREFLREEREREFGTGAAMNFDHGQHFINKFTSINKKDISNKQDSLKILDNILAAYQVHTTNFNGTSYTMLAPTNEELNYTFDDDGLDYYLEEKKEKDIEKDKEEKKAVKEIEIPIEQTNFEEIGRKYDKLKKEKAHKMEEKKKEEEKDVPDYDSDVSEETNLKFKKILEEKEKMDKQKAQEEFDKDNENYKLGLNAANTGEFLDIYEDRKGIKTVRDILRKMIVQNIKNADVQLDNYLRINEDIRNNGKAAGADPFIFTNSRMAYQSVIDDITFLNDIPTFKCDVFTQNLTSNHKIITMMINVKQIKELFFSCIPNVKVNVEKWRKTWDQLRFFARAGFDHFEKYFTQVIELTHINQVLSLLMLEIQKKTGLILSLGFIYLMLHFIYCKREQPV